MHATDCQCNQKISNITKPASSMFLAKFIATSFLHFISNFSFLLLEQPMCACRVVLKVGTKNEKWEMEMEK